MKFDLSRFYYKFKKGIPFTQRLRYGFESILSKGSIAIISMLAMVSTFIIIAFGIIYSLSGLSNDGAENMGFFESAWQTLMRSMDPGTVAGDEGWMFRIVGLIITIGGIFIFSALIGILTTGLDKKLDNLRKGRSKVLESGHTLILGWSAKVVTIISEIIIANENQKKPRIVILANKDKVEMEEEIRNHIKDFKNTKVICRTGSSIDVLDLEIVNPHEAKSIIILSPKEPNPDILVIKSILAITNNPKRKEGKYHILAEIKDKENIEVAELVGGNESIFIQSSEIIPRLTAQSCRQSGLSAIYTELFDFDGDEIYFMNEPELTGKTFEDAIFAYETSCVIGIMNIKNEVSINPPMEHKIKDGDQLIVITEDDDTVILSDRVDYNINENVISDFTPSKIYPERNCILGWNDYGKKIIQELDKYVGNGSDIFILADDKELYKTVDELKKNLKYQNISKTMGNSADKKTLENINITSYDNVIVLGNQNITNQEADAKTLITLLHLRNMFEKAEKKLNVVSEMYDVKNRDLARVTKADDFIISDRLISLMISQLSENKHLKKVFDNLLDPQGSEIYLKNIEEFIEIDSEVNFYTVLKSVTKKGGIAIGYRNARDSQNPEKAYGIVVNPNKFEIIKFEKGDKVVVIMED